MDEEEEAPADESEPTTITESIANAWVQLGYWTPSDDQEDDA